MQQRHQDCCHDWNDCGSVVLVRVTLADRQPGEATCQRRPWLQRSGRSASAGCQGRTRGILAHPPPSGTLRIAVDLCCKGTAIEAPRPTAAATARRSRNESAVGVHARSGKRPPCLIETDQAVHREACREVEVVAVSDPSTHEPSGRAPAIGRQQQRGAGATAAARRGQQREELSEALSQVGVCDHNSGQSNAKR